MKMPKEQFDVLRAAIEPLNNAANRESYRTGNYPRAHLTNDVDKRYRWDLFWAVKFKADWSNLDDSHIDTALRQIVPPL